MSFQTYDMKAGAISSTAVQINSTTFGFASTNLELAQRAVVAPLVNAISVSLTTTAPTAATFGIGVAANSHLVVNGSLAIQNIRVIAQASTAIVNIVLEK